MPPPMMRNFVVRFIEILFLIHKRLKKASRDAKLCKGASMRLTTHQICKDRRNAREHDRIDQNAHVLTE